jgi:hypothetical protein
MKDQIAEMEVPKVTKDRDIQTEEDGVYSSMFDKIRNSILLPENSLLKIIPERRSSVRSKWNKAKSILPIQKYNLRLNTDH